MGLHYSPHVIPLIVSTIVTSALGVYAARRHATPGATPFAILMLVSTIWAGAYALQVTSTEYAAKAFWNIVEGSASIVAPVAWLILALDYAGHRQWFQCRRLVLLCFIPGIMFILILTNNSSHLLFSSVYLRNIGPISDLVVEPTGPLYKLCFIYAYSYVLSFIIILLHNMWHVPKALLGQSVALLLGVSLPLLANVFGRRFEPYYPLEVTPLSFIPAGLVIAWGLFRYRLFNVVPMARNRVVENLADGVIVTDARGHIVDHNASALEMLRTMLPIMPPKLIGQPVAGIFSPWAQWVEAYRGAHETRIEIMAGEGASRRTFELTITPLWRRAEQHRGYLTLLHNATERRRNEEALRSMSEQLALVMDGVPALIAYVNAEKRYVLVNQAYAQWYKLSKEEVVGKEIREILTDPAAYERASCYYDAALSGRSVYFENTVPVDDGERTVSVNFVPYRNGYGQVLGFFALLFDITARKQAEREREALITELQEALANIKTLRGLVPICASCKKIRDDRGYWQAVEMYVSQHSEAEFTHGLCPDCMEKLYGSFLQDTEPDAPPST